MCSSNMNVNLLCISKYLFIYFMAFRVPFDHLFLLNLKILSNLICTLIWARFHTLRTLCFLASHLTNR